MRYCKSLIYFIAIMAVSCSSGSDKRDSGKQPGSKLLRQYIPFADPYILYHDGLYYAYGTSSDSGFDVYCGSELKYWRKHPQRLLSKEDSYADRWFWAPEVYYNQANQTFYLYYSADEHICVATSNSPTGPFKQSVKQPMYSEKAIDSSLFIDDDGTPYIFFVRFTNGNVIWAAELQADLTTIKEQTLVKCMEVSQDWEKHMGKVVEGPSVLKKDGVYYMLYSANDYRSPEYGVGFATASSPLGQWSKSNNNPIFHKPTSGLVGVGHGAPFKDKNGAMKYVFHAHSTPGTVQPRKMYVTDMSISQNGVSIDNSKIIYPHELQ